MHAFHFLSTWWQYTPNVSAFELGIKKTYNVGFLESEALQAVFASHLCPNVLKAPARSAFQFLIFRLEPGTSIVQSVHKNLFTF